MHRIISLFSFFLALNMHVNSSNMTVYVHVFPYDCHNCYSVYFMLSTYASQYDAIRWAYFSKEKDYEVLHRKIQTKEIILPSMMIEKGVPDMIQQCNLNLDSLLNRSSVFGFYDSRLLFTCPLTDFNNRYLEHVLKFKPFTVSVIDTVSFQSRPFYGDYNFHVNNKIYSLRRDSLCISDLMNKSVTKLSFIDSAYIYQVIKQYSASDSMAFAYFDALRRKKEIANFLNLRLIRSVYNKPFIITLFGISVLSGKGNKQEILPVYFFTFYNTETHKKNLQLIPNRSPQKYYPVYYIFNYVDNSIITPSYVKDDGIIKYYKINQNKLHLIRSSKLPFKTYSGDLLLYDHLIIDDMVFFLHSPFVYNLSSKNYFNLNSFLSLFNLPPKPQYTIYHPVVKDLIITSNDYTLYHAIKNDTGILMLFSFNNVFFRLEMDNGFQILSVGINGDYNRNRSNTIFYDEQEFYYFDTDNMQFIRYLMAGS